MKKNVFCRHFREGKCSKGAECAFAHGDDELVARDWPEFARLPRYASTAAQERWAVNVIWTAAPFGSKDLGDIYRRARGLKSVLEGRGGFKKFCEAFPDKLSFDGKVLRRAPEVPLSRVAELIRASAEKDSGGVEIPVLYEEHAGLEEAIRQHGGLVAVCAKAFRSPPRLAVARGRIFAVAHEALLPPAAAPRDNPPAAALLAGIREVARTLGHGASGAEAYAFGSSASGLAGQGSDWDVVLKVPQETIEHFQGADGVLRAFARQAPLVGDLVVVEKVLACRVPILKLMLDDTECDLSCNNLLPLFNTALLATYATLDTRLGPLVLEVKSWAKARGIHGARENYLSSYALTLLVIFYAQCEAELPCLQADLEPSWWIEGGRAFNVAMRSGHPEPRSMESELSLQGFARYFSRHEVLWGERVVSVRVGALLPAAECPRLKYVTDRQWDVALHIEDPFEESRNLSAVMEQEHFAHFREELRRLAADRCAGLQSTTTFQ